MTEVIDLRSDTVTKPTPAMRAAIAAAPVGDDQFGEDPTVNLLQQRVAELLGKEAALWLPTGTMANQVAVRALTRPGDDVIASRDAHVFGSETGGAAANSGVQGTLIGEGGVFSCEEFLEAVKPRGHIVFPPTTLVSIENTHNRSGGIVFPQAEARRICEAARERDIGSYLDGARLWNAAIATGTSPATLAAPFDVAGVALSRDSVCRPVRCSPALVPRLRVATGTVEWRVARCGRLACWPQPASMGSSITTTGLCRTMPMRGAWPNCWRRVRGSGSTSIECRRTSSYSSWGRRLRSRKHWLPRPANAAC